MDEYLDQYISKVMDEQVYRNGIEFLPSWLKRILARND